MRSRPKPARPSAPRDLTEPSRFIFRPVCDSLKAFHSGGSNAAKTAATITARRSLPCQIEALVSDLQYEYYEIIENTMVQRVDNLGLGEKNYLLCPSKVARQISLKASTPHGAI
jgi:hypothetical protein